MCSKADKPLVLYKDYAKDVKDILTKNYSESGNWKVECKFKGPKDTLFINPTATSDGKISTDVEYIVGQCGASFKANIQPNGDGKLTTAYNKWGHKAELTVNRQGKYEINHECTIQNRVTSHEKLVNDVLEVGFGIPVARHCSVGCGSVYKLQGKKTCDWSAVCRYADGKRIATIRTDKLQSYTTSLMTPMPKCPHHVLVAAEIVCGRGTGWKGTIGLEAGCPVLKGNMIRARINKNKEWALAYIAKVADNWTASVTFDKDFKVGVLLTHS